MKMPSFVSTRILVRTPGRVRSTLQSSSLLPSIRSDPDGFISAVPPPLSFIRITRIFTPSTATGLLDFPSLPSSMFQTRNYAHDNRDAISQADEDMDTVLQESLTGTTSLPRNAETPGLAVSRIRQLLGFQKTTTTKKRRWLVYQAHGNNQKIIKLGQRRNGSAILKFYERAELFNNVNYATTMTQLANMSYQHDYRSPDPSFLVLLDDLATILEDDQFGVEWMGVRQTANIAHAIGKMRLRMQATSRILKQVGQHAALIVETGEPQEVANTAWAFGRLQTKDSALFSEIDKHAKELLEKANTQQVCANIAWACASLGIQPPNLFSEIDKRADEIVNTGRPQEIANTAWACATLGVQSPHLFANIEKHASELLEWRGIRSQEMANMAWACAKLGVQSPNLFAEIEKHADVVISKGNMQTVSNTAWAFATLGVSSPVLFGEIDKHFVNLMGGGRGQAYANIAWACAKMDMKAPTLFHEIERRAADLIKSWNAQEVANIVWACSRLGVQLPDLFAQVDRHAVELVDNWSSQEVAITAWAFATLEQSSPFVFAEIDKRANRLVRTGRPQEVANTAWAFAKLGVQSSHLFCQIEKYAPRLVEQGNPHEVANIAWAFATLSVQSTRFFVEIEKHACGLVEKGNSQAVSNLAWACAELGVQSPMLFQEIERSAIEMLKKGKAQEIINTCYALVILGLGKKHEGALSQLWEEAMKRSPEDFARQELNQIAQIYIFSGGDGTSLTNLPAALLEKMKSAGEGAVHAHNSSSQGEVSSLLTEIGFLHEVGVHPVKAMNVPGGVLAIDMASQSDMTAIEFDGPTNFLRSVETGELTRNENGPTQAKRRFLESVFWKVINIHHLDWNEAETKVDKLSFLRSLLKAASVPYQA